MHRRRAIAARAALHGLCSLSPVALSFRPVHPCSRSGACKSINLWKTVYYSPLLNTVQRGILLHIFHGQEMARRMWFILGGQNVAGARTHSCVFFSYQQLITNLYVEGGRQKSEGRNQKYKNYSARNIE